MENDKQRLVELFEQLEDPSLTCPRMGTNARCEGCKYLKGNGCDLTERFVDYFLANGVIVPPCKVGDNVYWLDNGKIKSDEVFEISIHSDGILVHTGIQFCLEQVFLTKEEAEQALNNIQNGNSCEGGVQG